MQLCSILFYILIILSISERTLCSYLCRRIPNLNNQQLRICQQAPEIIAVIRSGIQLALRECEALFQFQPLSHPSWNCSAWIANSTNRLSVAITHDQVAGTKEAGFAHALFSAGITYSISEACTRGNFSHCHCGRRSSPSPDTPPNDNWLSISSTGDNDWKWNGCSHNIDYGIEMARSFLDSNEHEKSSIDSLLNLHNNLMGRRLVKEEMKSQCQCHGYSGTCSVKTCWKSPSMFTSITESLFRRYQTAKKVSFMWLLQSYKNKLNNRKRQLKGSGDRQKQLDHRMKWLKKLEKQFLSVTKLEYNQPSLERIMNESQLSIHKAQAKKNELVYNRASYSYCEYANSTLSNRVRRSSAIDKPLTCSIDSDPNDQLDYHSHYHPSYGAVGRRKPEPCTSICCNRGYRSRRVQHTQECECKFYFCCKLDCTA